MNELPDVPGKEPGVDLLLDTGLEPWQLALDIAAIPVEALFACLNRQNLLLGEGPLELLFNVRGRLLGDRLLHVLPQGHALEEATDHVEDLVGA